MQTAIKTHLEDLHTSATRMLVLNSDNKMLISYFKEHNFKYVIVILINANKSISLYLLLYYNLTIK